MCIYSFCFNRYELDMNYLLIPCVLFSSLSFMAYSISYFVSPHMESEFERFNLKHLGLFIIILEILGAFGLLLGLFFKPILIIASCGLSVLMLLGFITRIKVKDGFLVSFPAIFYMILNGYILYLGVIT
jgi:hypothetical protein